MPPSPYASVYDTAPKKPADAEHAEDAHAASDINNDHTVAVRRLPKEWGSISVREFNIPMHKWRDVVTARVGVRGNLARGRSWHGLKSKGFQMDRDESSDEDMAGDGISAEHDRDRRAIYVARELARHHFPKTWIQYRKRILAHKFYDYHHSGAFSNSRSSHSSKDSGPEPAVDAIHVQPWTDDEMQKFTKKTCATLWNMVNRRLLGRAKLIDPADEKEYKKVERMNHNGWFFSDVVSYMPPLRKIVSIACGAGHVCAITSRMNGSQLYTWGHNGHGQLGWGYKTIRDPHVTLTTSVSYAGTPHRVHFFAVPENKLLSLQRANHEWRDRHRTDKELVTDGTQDCDVADGSVHRKTVVERICRVSSVCCGPSYTVCAGIGSGDGVTSVFSWGQVSRLSFDANRVFLKERKMGRQAKRNDSADQARPWHTKHGQGGTPHDLERVPPQEVIRLIPAPVEGLNAQRIARRRNRDPSRVAKAILFFPLPCYTYMRNEWKRWRLDHANEVEQFNAKSSRRFKAESRFAAYASKFLRMGVRPVPCLQSKERAVFVSRAQQLRTFGESNERVAAMTSGLITDISQLCNLNTSAWKKNSVSETNVDSWVRGYIDSCRIAQALAKAASLSPLSDGSADTASTVIGSELKRLCSVPLTFFDAAADTHNGDSTSTEKAVPGALSGQGRPTGQAAGAASSSADGRPRALFINGGKGGYTIPSDAGWTEINGRQAVCEKK